MQATVKAHTAGKAKIKWSEKQVTGELSPGGKSTSQVEFTSDQALQDIVIEAVPAISGLVDIQPNSLNNIPANQPQTISLHFHAPADTPLGTRAGTIHVRSGSRTIAEPLKVAIDIKEGIVELPPNLLSLAEVTLSGASEITFNPPTASLRFDVNGATLITDPSAMQVFINNNQAPAIDLQITANSVAFPATFAEGLNLVKFIARDSEGPAIYKEATIWAGSNNLSVSVLDEHGQPAADALVTAMLGDDKRVTSSAQSVNGSVIFGNLPDWTIILRASASGNRIATVATNGGAYSATLRLRAFNTPSTIDNNDFSQGTAGWEIGSVPVKIVPHIEGDFIPLPSFSTAESSLASQSSAAGTEDLDKAAALRAERHAQYQLDASSSRDQASGTQTNDAQSLSSLSPAEGDTDIMLPTVDDVPQTISRTFQPAPGTLEIKIRYKFITSEVPGGFFGTQFNDYFDISLRTQNAGGVESESHTMNGLGLSAFDANGETIWYEFTLPVKKEGDTVQLDATVANVADGLLDSQLVIDYVAEAVVTIGALIGVVKGNQSSVEVKVGNPQGDIKLKLETTSGSGEALFLSTGSDTMTITQTTSVDILGVTESSDVDNISLKAFNEDDEELASEDFSVVWVTMDLKSTPGTSVSADNDKHVIINWLTGTTALGTLHSTGDSAKHWRNCVEIVGKVSPPDFVGTLRLPRFRLQGAIHTDQHSTLLGYHDDSTGPNAEYLRDYKTEPNGNIYDYDSPGVATTSSAPDGTVARQRVRFVQYATYEENNSLQKASDEMFWFSRISVVKTPLGDVLKMDVPGDNVAGKGTTNLTWNLQ